MRRQEHQWHADGVIFAVPAARLAGLVETVAPRTAAAAARIDKHILGGAGDGRAQRGIAFEKNPGVLVATGEQLHAKAITLSSRKWGRRTGMLELLRLSSGGSATTWRIRASDDELLAWALDDLATAFELTIDPVDVCIQRWPDAMPQYGPGHRDLVAELRAGLPTTLAVAGSYLDGIGVPACIGAAGRAVTSTIKAVESSVAR